MLNVKSVTLDKLLMARGRIDTEIELRSARERSRLIKAIGELRTGAAAQSSAARIARPHVVITDAAGEDAYPIAATSFALMYSTPRVASRARAAVDFFRWGLQHGQSQATELGYVALHLGVVSRIEDYWRVRLTDAALVSKQP